MLENNRLIFLCRIIRVNKCSVHNTEKINGLNNKESCHYYFGFRKEQKIKNDLDFLSQYSYT